MLRIGTGSEEGILVQVLVVLFMLMFDLMGSLAVRTFCGSCFWLSVLLSAIDVCTFQASNVFSFEFLNMFKNLAAIALYRQTVRS